MNLENIEYPPEKLNLWDRFFNRYRKIPIEEKTITRQWIKNYKGYDLKGTEYTTTHTIIVYKVIDRLTGSVTITEERL